MVAQKEEGPKGGRKEKEVVAMALSPFRGRGFYDMQSEMNRMFDEMFGGLARVGGRQQGAQPMQWAPALDVLPEGGGGGGGARAPAGRAADAVGAGARRAARGRGRRGAGRAARRKAGGR